VQGQVAETAARLAWARGDAADAIRRARGALARYEEVGAAVDVVRARALVAGCSGDREAVEAADAELRRLGALGYLDEVDSARRLLDRS
jgi:hypothetical protein